MTIQTHKSSSLMFFFLEKIKKYEDGIYEIIRNMVGLPRMKVGSLFRFSNQTNDLHYQVVKVLKVEPVESMYKFSKTQQSMTMYKYGYCIKDYHGIQMLNFIYDSYVNAGYIKIISW